MPSVEYNYVSSGSIVSGGLSSVSFGTQGKVIYDYVSSGGISVSGSVEVTPIIIARFLELGEYVGEIELNDNYIEEFFSQTVDVFYCEYVANTFVGTTLDGNVISVSKDFEYLSPNIIPMFTPYTVTIESKYEDVFFDNTSVQYVTRGSSGKIEQPVKSINFNGLDKNRIQVFEFVADDRHFINLSYSVATTAGNLRILHTVLNNYDIKRDILVEYV